MIFLAQLTRWKPLPATHALASREQPAVHGCLADDPMRARTDHAAHNLVILRQFVLNLPRLAPVRRNGGLKVQCIIAGTSDTFCAELLGLV